MQGTRNTPNPNDYKITCKNTYFAHKCKDMSVTLTLDSLASVCPPHLRLHCGPSASPCLMLFTGEQRIFLRKDQVHSSAVLVEANAASAAALGLPSFRPPASSISQSLWCFTRGQHHQHLKRMFKIQEESPSARWVIVATSCKLFVSYRWNLGRIIAQRNYKDSYNCPCKLIIGFLDWDKFAAEPLEKLKSAMSFKIARTRTANYIWG